MVKRTYRLLDFWAISLLLLALVGLFLTPHDPMAQVFRDNALGAPSLSNWLGIDGLGRDFASRLWKGSGNTVILASGSMLIAIGLGSLLVSVEQGGPAWCGRFIRMGIGLWVAMPVIFIGLLLLVFARQPVMLPVAPSIVPATCVVRRSCTWRRRANTSTRREIFERPTIFPRGM